MDKKRIELLLWLSQNSPEEAADCILRLRERLKELTPPPHVCEAMERIEEWSAGRVPYEGEEWIKVHYLRQDCRTVAYWVCDAMANAPRGQEVEE